MHRSTGLLILAGATLCLSACNSRTAADSNDAIAVQNAQAQPPAGPAPAETRGQEFVSTVMGGFDFAIASAKMLGEKAESASARRFGQAMAADFTASLDSLKAIARAGHLKLEPQAGPVDQTDLALLSSATGKPVEQAFAAQQAGRLSELLGLIRAYKNGGDNPELKAWAEKAQIVVNDRLLAVQTLKAEMEDAQEK